MASGIRVVDDSRRVAIGPLLPTIGCCREERIVFGFPFDLLNRWLPRCADRKTIVEVLVTDPLLREERPSNEQHAGCSNNSHDVHEQLLQIRSAPAWRERQSLRRPGHEKPATTPLLLMVLQHGALNAWDGNRTRTPLAGLRILSPVRLPVPPPRRKRLSIAFSMLAVTDDRLCILKTGKADILPTCPVFSC